jgi:CRISPR-associated endonuclease/helicase Cas3
VEFYAHTDPNHPEAKDAPNFWEPLFTDCYEGCRCGKCGHLNKVAALAAEFAEAIFPANAETREKAAKWGRAAGIWHDLGKFNADFQNYLTNASGKADPHQAETQTAAGVPRVDHSSAGAQHAAKIEPVGTLLSYIIAGHHAGLADGRDQNYGPTSLESRLKKTDVPDWKSPNGFPLSLELPLPPLSPGQPQDLAHKIAFFTRMIFSGLVDADFLATEAFMAPKRQDIRPKWPTNILQQMADALQERFNLLAHLDSPINNQRRLVLQNCLSKAEQPPGLFTLTVPTGGGKTLSSLAFALRHAIKNGLRRIIYVIPFTSIIEQNADVFRSVFSSLKAILGQSPVLEHHSNLEPAKESAINRLAAENWDSPLVVTTNVQFFESLFSNKTSRCRKLHRIANSVVIFDEAQNLPVSYLSPSLSALRILLQDYHTTLLLCTATQPAITWREDFTIGLPNHADRPTEIIENVPQLFQILRRTNVEYLGPTSDQQLLTRIRQNNQSLTVVNTRRHAAELFLALGDCPDHFHLSAQMCPDHRSAVIREIRDRLEGSRPCHLISTQLIEAGVDIDFPVVFRAIAGLDSIAQAAGRCNREARLPEPGQVFVFEPEHPIPAGHLRQTADTARPLLREPDLLAPDTIQRYFENHYWKRSDEWDQKQIMHEFVLSPDLLGFNFAAVARDFRLIENEMPSIIVPYGEQVNRVIQQLRSDPLPSYRVRRQAQRLMVQIHPRTYESLTQAGYIRPVDPEERYFALTNRDLYHPKLGVLSDSQTASIQPETLISA